MYFENRGKRILGMVRYKQKREKYGAWEGSEEKLRMHEEAIWKLILYKIV